MTLNAADWRFYMDNREGAHTSISYNKRLAASSPDATRPLLLWHAVKMHAPNHNGLTSPAEGKLHDEIEEDLALGLGDGPLYVSCVTTEGEWQFIYYAPREGLWLERLAAAMGRYSTYMFRHGTLNDPEWRIFRESICPRSPRSRHQVTIYEELQRLKEGQGQLPAKVYLLHDLTFATAEAASTFLAQAAAAGYTGERRAAADLNAVAVRIGREEKCEQWPMSQALFEVVELAKPVQGQYQGCRVA